MLANDIRASARVMQPARNERSREAQLALGAVVHGLLTHHRQTPQRIEELIAIDPGAAIGHAIRGLALSLQMRSDLSDAVAAALLRAEVALHERGGCEAELALTAALRAASAGWTEAALAVMDAQVEAIPFDLLTLKLAHAMHFLIGDTVGMRHAVDAALAALPRGTPMLGYAMGCQAFAHVESGDVTSGERIGRDAVALAPDDAWGVHAVAHALTTRGAHRACVEWLRASTPGLAEVNNFGGHVAWHEAMSSLALGQDDAALALYDTRIRVHLGGDYRDAVNAVTLLHRLRRRGHDVRDRAAQLADHVAPRLGDHGSAFADVHYVMALGEAASGDPDDRRARDFARSMRLAADATRTHQARLAREVACDLADAIVALREGRPSVSAFEATRAGWPRLGGSRLQRDAFEQLRDEARDAANR